MNSLFAQSVNQHRKEIGIDPLTTDQVLSESEPENLEPPAAPQPVEPQPPGPQTSSSAVPNEIVARSTDYTSLSEPVQRTSQLNTGDLTSSLLIQALSRLSDPATLSKEIYTQATAVIPKFTQAPSCSTCKASTLDSSLNQLTCQNYNVLVLSNYICGSHQAFTQTQSVETEVVTVEEPIEVEPVVTPTDPDLFAQVTEKAKLRSDLSTEDQEVYALVLYKKAFKEKTGSLEGSFSIESEFAESYKSTAKEKMTQYRKKKSTV